MTLYLGLMSGTSMDGIDAALMDVKTHSLLAGVTIPYEAHILMQLNEVMSGQPLLPKVLWQLNRLLGEQFAKAARTLMSMTDVDAHDIQAIGSHGQTIAHDASASIPYTIQLGCPHTISALTHQTVVADFRTRDMVLGGQGAPLAPLYHHAVFGHEKNMAVVNIGGIANMSFWDQTGIHGYDLGPGNALMDAWIHQNKGDLFDYNGDYAASGRVLNELLAALLADPLIQAPYPKSMCRTYFSLEWLGSFLSVGADAADIQATLLALTAHVIVRAVYSSGVFVKKLAICGGGARNSALMRTLQTLLPEIEVISTEALGLSTDFLEAMMCAWLAHQTLTQTALDLRTITGSSYPMILGAIYRAAKIRR